MKRFLSLDFETSTDDPKTGFCCSVGVALFDGDALVDTYGAIMKPPVDKAGRLLRAWDVEAMAISGFDVDTLLRIGKPIPAVLWGLHDWAAKHDARDLIVTAYNAPFDMAFYGVSLRVGHYAAESGEWVRPTPPLRGPWQDTRILAQDTLDEVKPLTLASVAGALGVGSQSDKHDATEDAILNGRVFAKLAGYAGYQTGYNVAGCDD